MIEAFSGVAFYFGKLRIREIASPAIVIAFVVTATAPAAGALYGDFDLTKVTAAETLCNHQNWSG